MYLLIGADTPLGQAFCLELTRRRTPFLPVSLADHNLADLHAAYELLRKSRPSFVINASGPGFVAPAAPGEEQKQAILYSRVLVPQSIAQVCKMRNVPWLHASSGRIFQGAKVLQQQGWITELDLERPWVARLIESQPDRICGFAETDEPNHSFLCPPCDFDSGAVALGEQATHDVGNSYVCRHGMLLDNRHRLIELPGPPVDDESARSGSVSRYVSASYVSDYVAACLELRKRRAPYGAYHVINPGILNLNRGANVRGVAECEEQPAPIRSFILDDAKLRATGIVMRQMDLAGVLMTGKPALGTEPAFEHSFDSHVGDGDVGEELEMSATSRARLS